MKVPVSTLNNLMILFVIFAIGVIGFFVFTNKSSDAENVTDKNVVTTVDGRQVINLIAKGGYSPARIEAQAGIETTLKVSTQSTFDCSSALTIPSLGVNKNLPPTGETEIEIGMYEPGETLNGTCSMGMYSFQIKFI